MVKKQKDTTVSIHDRLADTPLTDDEFRRGRIALLPRKARLATGLTQVEFAKTYNIPLPTIRDWEQGRREPDSAAKNYLQLIRKAPKDTLELLSAEPA